MIIELLVQLSIWMVIFLRVLNIQMNRQCTFGPLSIREIEVLFFEWANEWPLDVSQTVHLEYLVCPNVSRMDKWLINESLFQLSIRKTAFRKDKWMANRRLDSTCEFGGLITYLDALKGSSLTFRFYFYMDGWMAIDLLVFLAQLTIYTIFKLIVALIGNWNFHSGCDGILCDFVLLRACEYMSVDNPKAIYFVNALHR